MPAAEDLAETVTQLADAHWRRGMDLYMAAERKGFRWDAASDQVMQRMFGTLCQGASRVGQTEALPDLFQKIRRSQVPRTVPLYSSMLKAAVAEDEPDG